MNIRKFFILALLFLQALLHGSILQARVEVQKVENYLKQFQQTLGLNGNVLIGSAGKVEMVRSFGYQNILSKQPFDIQSQFVLGSLSKQFTAVAVLKLIEQGHFKLTDFITDLLPKYRDTPWAQGVRVEHLLSHTSGIYEPTPLELSDVQHFQSLDKILKFLKSKPSRATPGLLYLYSNYGYHVAGHLVEHFTGLALEDYMKNRLFDPLGMSKTLLVRYHKPTTNTAKIASTLAAPHRVYDSGRIGTVNTVYNEFAYAAAGVVSTVEDLFTWNEALYSGVVINKKLLQQLLMPRHMGYGLGISIETLPKGNQIYSHGGAIDGYQSLLMYLPKQKTTVCVLTNVDYPTPHRIEALKDHLAMLVLE